LFPQIKYCLEYLKKVVLKYVEDAVERYEYAKCQYEETGDTCKEMIFNDFKDHMQAVSETLKPCFQRGY
jgi:hypothetical protein